MRIISDSSEPQAGFDAERNSAFAIGVLHWFVVFGVSTLLWNSAVIERSSLIVWACVEAILGMVSFVACFYVLKRRINRFVMLSRAESFGTSLTFAALPWLGDAVASSTPSKHVLMIALIAVTSISAANSSHITRRRPFFGRLIVIVGVSYTVAFSMQSEWIFAALSVLWCFSIAMLTRVGYHGMLELLELRAASDRNAKHDDLTDLLSRSAFLESLDAQAAHAQQNNETSALVLFDLDGFKAINDSFGHPAGDAVLKAVARRLQVFLPHGSIIARLGGDEFAAIVSQCEEPLDVIIAAVLRSVSDPVRLDNRELYVAASAGWTDIDGGRFSAELIAEADAAMYRSKNSQTAISTAFNVELRDELDRSLNMRQRFRTSLKRSEITFFAQPLVRMTDRLPVAVELLARWPQHDDSSIGPSEFTRVAEETGLAIELDRQALACASELLTSWSTDPELSKLRVKANISPLHLYNNELINSVNELVPRPLWGRLGLEFVESTLIPAAERNRTQLRDLLAMGVMLSIDDFGVGYSSLTYLRALPVNEIKIDRSFLTNLDSDRINQGLIRAIVDIASTLGLPTVAEGIETEGEFAAAQRLGVSNGQGYYFGHPMPVQEVEVALRELLKPATLPEQAR